MANELVIHYPTGRTLYALLFDATGQIYNGLTFEEPVSANWATYDIAMTEAATATGIYRATMPAVAAGAYGWVVCKQAGGSPAVSDITVGTGAIRWTGTAEETVPAAVNVTLWQGATAPAMTGDAFARLGAPAGASVSADIAAIPTAGEIDTELSGTHGDGSWEGGASGAGTVTWTYTLMSSVDDTPIADADVWVTTDAGGSNVIASGQTDQYGRVEFELDPGTIYVWRQKSGWNFSNPDAEVVS